MKILVPQSIDFTAPNTKDTEFVVFDQKSDIPEEHWNAEMLVVWDMPFTQQQKAAMQLKNLRCVQALSAGVDSLLALDFPDSATICSGSGLHTIPVAEHTLFLLLMAARRGHEMRDLQHERKWAKHLGGVQPVQPKNDFRSLKQANVVIWGFGSIGRYLASILKELGAHVTGVATEAGERDGFPVVTEDDLDQVLPMAHALVMILPSTPSTRHALSAARIAKLPSHAWVVNVGRGSTVDEEALVDALQKGAIAGAALDVFATEPLPQDSPLWGLKNVFVSPHAAGGRPLGAQELILRQVDNIRTGEPLENAVSAHKGY